MSMPESNISICREILNVVLTLDLNAQQLATANDRLLNRGLGKIRFSFASVDRRA